MTPAELAAVEARLDAATFERARRGNLAGVAPMMFVYTANQQHDVLAADLRALLAHVRELEDRLHSARTALTDIMDDAAMLVPHAPALYPALAGIWHVAANATGGGDSDNLPLPAPPSGADDLVVARVRELEAEREGAAHARGRERESE